MCGNPFKRPSYSAQPTPAAAVSAPQQTIAADVDTQKSKRDMKSKGKRKLTISRTASGSGSPSTGVNI